IGFHLGKLASGSGALYLAHWYDWQTSYQMMSLGILPGLFALLAFRESGTANDTAYPHSQTPLRLSIQTLFKHKNIYYIIAFILIFKMSDAVLQGTAATFLYQLGLTKIEFANYTKLYGTFWIIIGVTLGGFIVQWLSVYTATIVAAFVQMCACLTFSIQAHIGYDPFVLGISIALENFASGIVTCTLIAMISHFVRRSMFNVSHYTTLYAFGSLSRVSVSVFSGYLAYHMGWTMLYLSLAFLFIPMFFLIYHLQKEHKKHKVYDKVISFEKDAVYVRSTKAKN
ncbi:MAG: hypothetical protein Q8K36_04245, partial [Alphaproteobacteria bacterium]|nr:hypothetical protein [Alphaproteobacteria bacterium]